MRASSILSLLLWSSAISTASAGLFKKKHRRQKAGTKYAQHDEVHVVVNKVGWVTLLLCFVPFFHSVTWRFAFAGHYEIIDGRVGKWQGIDQRGGKDSSTTSHYFLPWNILSWIDIDRKTFTMTQCLTNHSICFFSSCKILNTQHVHDRTHHMHKFKILIC